MPILYRPVCNLQLWHDFMLGQPDPAALSLDDYAIGDWLEIVPTRSCAQQLQNLRWAMRPQSFGGVIFARIEPDGSDFRSFVPLERAYRLSFWIRVKNPAFYQATNLPMQAEGPHGYHFSNLSGVAGHALFLTAGLPPYAGGNDYRVGALVQHAGQTWEAHQRLSNPAAPAPGGPWEALPTSEYVSDGDRLPLTPRSLRHQLASANPGDTYQVELRDILGQPALLQEGSVGDEHPPGEPFMIHVDLSRLEPGRYEMLVNGASLAPAQHYLHLPTQAHPQALALIEVAINHPSIPSRFTLTGSDSLIQPRNYVIRFKNLATRWRYRYRVSIGGVSPINGATVNPTGWTLDTSTQTILADTPQALRAHYPFDALPFIQAGGNEVKLPAPALSALRPKKQAGPQITEFYSDIFL
jgi:hypothetical protein